MWARVFSAMTLALTTVAPSYADDDNRTVKGIEDNSFLIEEAYNQERGVVQHIATLHRQQRNWFFGFTQEWPLGSQDHQFSYTVPYSWLRNEDRRVHGLGDVELNYRWQALYEKDWQPAFAPRFSLILPTGDSREELGVGSPGVGLLLPFSKVISDRVALHANLGITSHFDVRGHQPTSYLAGGSAVYAVTREFNLLLEALAEREESVNDERQLEREDSLTISPGFRYAFNLKPGQLVLGLGAPIRFTREATDYGAFVYLSFEHKFLRTRNK